MIALAIYAFTATRPMGDVRYTVQEVPPQIPCPLPAQHGRQQLKWTSGGVEPGL
jgi:hypothetical protein